jgi:hypothetical protein
MSLSTADIIKVHQSVTAYDRNFNPAPGLRFNVLISFFYPGLAAHRNAS